MVANQFFDELNAGLPDSSHFNADVRLGRRGLMSRADAVGELRKLSDKSDKYHKINCRMDGNSLTLKTPEFAQSGFRAKVYADCDFTDKSDVVTTRRFPLNRGGCRPTWHIVDLRTVAVGGNGVVATSAMMDVARVHRVHPAAPRCPVPAGRLDWSNARALADQPLTYAMQSV